MGKYDKFKNDVLQASLWLSDNGYFGSMRGTGGNVSVRVEGEDLLAVTPSSVKYHEITTEDICICDLTGAVVEGARAPSVEAGMHAAIYRERPDVNAIVHTHQIYGSVFGLLNKSIPALFDEVAFTLGEVVDVVPYALSGSPQLVANVAGKMVNNANAYIIQNHGIIALGKNMDKALLGAELLEKVAHIYYLALSTGLPLTTLPKEISDMVKGMREFEVGEARKKKKAVK